MISAKKGQRVGKRFSLKNRAWSYRGEGNANLVLSLTEERKIIRFRKSQADETLEEEKKMWLEMDFCKGVMLPLLGEEFVQVPTVVRLSESEVADLNDRLEPVRPAHRHDKKVYSKHAFVFPDLCLLRSSDTSFRGPTFCVEVKPKQGWIPIPDRRLSKCTFCLNQYLKLKQCSVKEKSEYCPLDLFSGNRVRMKRAVKSLLVTPQNNLKMFKNGKLVYGDATEEHFGAILEDWFGFGDPDKLAENFAGLVVDALVSEFSESSPRDLTGHRSEWKKESPDPAWHRIPPPLVEEAQNLLSGQTCFADPEFLPQNCILSRILRVQQLEVLGSDEVYHLYRSSILHREDFAYVYDMLLNPGNMFKPINSYLLATTAKDCSILIAFQRVSIYGSDYEYCMKDSNDVYYNFNVGISDLDPKPASCIEKHRKRDYDVVVSCIELLRSQK